MRKDRGHRATVISRVCARSREFGGRESDRTTWDVDVEGIKPGRMYENWCARGKASKIQSELREYVRVRHFLTRRETCPAATKRDARPGNTASNQEPRAPSVSVVSGGPKMPPPPPTPPPPTPPPPTPPPLPYSAPRCFASVAHLRLWIGRQRRAQLCLHAHAQMHSRWPDSLRIEEDPSDPARWWWDNGFLFCI